jgi:hypothetical protein
MRLAIVCGFIGVALASCGGPDEAPAGKSPADCGFPAVESDADPKVLDEAFVVEGAEVLSTSVTGKLTGGHLYVPLSVQAAFDSYTTILVDEGFEVVSDDNEQVEAEIYFKRGKDLGSIQIRRSTCEGASSVFLNLPR